MTILYGAGAMGMLGISPLTPALRDGLALTRLEIGLLIPAIYVAGLVFSLPGGHLADRVGVRDSLVGGLVLAGGALGLAAAAPGLGWLLASLAVAGVGWTVVNPALGKAIMGLFPPRERGVAMGIKQMGLTIGGVAGAVLLPSVAERWGWRAAVLACAATVLVPALAGWKPLASLAGPDPGSAAPSAGSWRAAWWWLRRPPVVVLGAAGVGFGMLQSAVLSYLPLFSVQALGTSAVGAGALLAVAQAGGAAARLGLGAASDRWLGGRRVPWMVGVALLCAGAFALYAWRPPGTLAGAGIIAFLAGVGSFGWVGLYLVLSAEVGGTRQAGLLTGIAFASIVAGLLAGGPLFGLLLEAADAYASAWTLFAGIALAVGVLLAAAEPTIRRECERASQAPARRGADG